MLLGGRRVSGSDLVVDLLLPTERVGAVDLVITGEGSLDWQSLRGKLVTAVARRCGEAARPCLVLAGRSSVGRREAAAAGIAEAHAVADLFGLTAALADPAERLADLASEVAAAWRS
jgi:glycerate kinase